MHRTKRLALGCQLGLATALAIAGVAPAVANDATYLDDRSTPQKLVESYYFAVSHRYYAQAFSYFRKDTAPADFESWANGYSDTGTVTVKFGETAADPGAGQIFWSLPVAISVAKTDGTNQIYSGCYKIHLANPGMQSTPPYQPMAIVSATMKISKGSFEATAPGPC